MPGFGWKKRCLRAEAQNARLRQQNGQLEERVRELEARNAHLVQALAAANKHSGHSSKPPSSDMVKAPTRPAGSKKRRKIGGQPGHPKHERAAFGPEQIDHRIVYQLQRCPVDGSHPLEVAPGQRKIIQQVEWVEKPFVVTEHVAQGSWRPTCQQVHYAPLPSPVLAGGLLAELKQLFCVLHRRAQCSAKAFALALATAEAKIWDAAVEPVLHPRRYPQVHRLVDNLVHRFAQHGEGYFRFVTSGIEPTNNSAEQALRFVVMDRHVTQGARGQRGRDFCERIWTVMATCVLQKRSAYAWIPRQTGLLEQLHVR